MVELIVAIAVIEIGIFSVWSLFLVNFNAEREAEMRIVGVNLAREGVEAVKNIRDSNWLKNAKNSVVVPDNPDSAIWPWDKFLEAGDYSANYDSGAGGSALPAAQFDQLYLNEDGFYTNLESAQKTFYKRKITLSDICCVDSDNNFQCDADKSDYSTMESGGFCPPGSLKIGIDAVCNVTWEISGKPRNAIVEDRIFNWKQ